VGISDVSSMSELVSGLRLGVKVEDRPHFEQHLFGTPLLRLINSIYRADCEMTRRRLDKGRLDKGRLDKGNDWRQSSLQSGWVTRRIEIFNA
jgi:hypothetical protein